MSRLRVRVVTDIAQLDRCRADWDALAVSSSRPLSAPAWLLSWWDTMAPKGALPRVVIVSDVEGGVIGVAPFYARRRGLITEYRLFGSGMASRNAPLAAPGREREVAAGVARALARATPHPSVVHLDQADHDSPWPRLLADAWPGRRPSVVSRTHAPAPTLDIAGTDPDAWLASKSSHFRKRLRQSRRKLEANGACIRVTEDVGELDRAMAAFTRLHGERWGDQSPLSTEAGRELMHRAGEELMPEGRFRAAIVEAGDHVVSVDFLVAAGGDVVCWNGGWDSEWAPYSPAMHGLVVAVQDAIRRGDRRVDFGQGDHQYKLRLADGDAPVAWPSLYPRTVWALPARAVALLGRLRIRCSTAVDRLPLGLGARIRRLARRPPSEDGERDGDGAG